MQNTLQEIFWIFKHYLKNNITEKKPWNPENNLEILKNLTTCSTKSTHGIPPKPKDLLMVAHTEVLPGTGSRLRAMSQSIPSLSSSSYIPLSLLVQMFLNCSSNAGEHQWAPACK